MLIEKKNRWKFYEERAKANHARACGILTVHVSSAEIIQNCLGSQKRLPPSLPCRYLVIGARPPVGSEFLFALHRIHQSQLFLSQPVREPKRLNSEHQEKMDTAAITENPN
jgi:hypothetical protein